MRNVNVVHFFGYGQLMMTTTSLLWCGKWYSGKRKHCRWIKWRTNLRWNGLKILVNDYRYHTRVSTSTSFLSLFQFECEPYWADINVVENIMLSICILTFKSWFTCCDMMLVIFWYSVQLMPWSTLGGLCLLKCIWSNAQNIRCRCRE